MASGYDAGIDVFDLRKVTSHESDDHMITRLEGHSWEVWQLEYTDGIIFSGSFDHEIRRWEKRSWNCTAVLRGHKGFVHALTLGDQSLISGCADRTIKIWR